jgi:hypothetical protein
LRRCLDTCGPSQLRVGLFVTHSPRSIRGPYEGVPSLSGPLPVDTKLAGDDELAPPTPYFVRGQPGRPGVGRSDSNDSFASIDTDGEDSDAGTPTRTRFRQDSGNGAAADSEDDFVLFEGESEIRTKMEADISSKVKKEGKLRRAHSRRTAGAKWPAKLRPNSMRGGGGNNDPPPADIEPSHQPSHRLSDGGGGGPYAHSFSSAPRRGNASPSNSLDFGEGGGGLGTPMSASFRHLLSEMAEEEKDVPMDLLPPEQEDLDVIAELAQAGRPNLGALLDEEKEAAKGKIMVACTSFWCFMSQTCFPPPSARD